MSNYSYPAPSNPLRRQGVAPACRAAATEQTMSSMSRLHRLAAGVAVLALALPAAAAPADDLIAARDAFKRNDMNTLARLAETFPSDHVLAPYPAFWLAWKAVETDDDATVERFLSRQGENLLTERLRNEWVKRLGQRQDWARTARELARLPEDGRDEESRCYATLVDLQQGRPANLPTAFEESRPLPEGCNRLIEAAAQRQMVGPAWLWKRVRLLLAGNYQSQARQLAASTGLLADTAPLVQPALADLGTVAGQEARVFEIVRKARGDLPGASTLLQTLEPQLTREQAGFAWGQLATQAARKLQPAQALVWYERADPAQLTDDDWSWRARSALRLENWTGLDVIVRAMPSRLAETPAWLYWRGRALKALGRTTEGQVLLARASRGHHYYALLAQESLGTSLSEPPAGGSPSEAQVRQVSSEPAIRRALELHEIAGRYSRPELRTDAQREWRWAMRNRTDTMLLAAAEAARRAGFYDMAIYSAERTREEHDFSLRYLTPYRDITRRYAGELGIDEAWVYGLIRQESRFVNVARSGVGASGLMQLMPATAKWVAGKIGLGRYVVNDVDTNIQLGTWYLRHVLDTLSGSPVLATAAYNAGPGRARGWQDSRPLEGPIYAETIPFDETRDYVQKVMANAAYYAGGLNRSPLALSGRMGVVPAR